MNWGQFKDPLPYLCLVGSVVTLWSLTQEQWWIQDFPKLGANLKGEGTNLLFWHFSQKLQDIFLNWTKKGPLHPSLKIATLSNIFLKM